MREGKFATVAMREGPQPKNEGSALARLTTDDLCLLLDLAEKHRVACVRRSHEKPNDEFYQNEAKHIKRVYELLRTAILQRP